MASILTGPSLPDINKNGFYVAAGEIHHQTGQVVGKRLLKTGPGTTHLANGGNTHTDGTEIKDGIILVDLAGALSTGPVIFSTGATETATLQIGADVDVGNELQFITNGTVDSNGHVMRASSRMTGSGTCNKVGTGSFIPSNITNNNTGSINLLAGSLEASDPRIIGGDGATIPTINISSSSVFKTSAPGGNFRNPIAFSGQSATVNATEDTTLSGTLTATTGELTIMGVKHVTLSGEQHGAFDINVLGVGAKLSMKNAVLTTGRLKLGMGTEFEAEGISYFAELVLG